MITTNENTYDYINLGYMDMMSDGDDDMKKVMLEMLLDELPEETNKMRQFADAADWKNLMEASHKMKSTLAFVGNPSMTETNKEIERLSKEESELSRIPVLLAELEELVPKTISELKKEFGRL